MCRSCELVRTVCIDFKLSNADHNALFPKLSCYDKPPKNASTDRVAYSFVSSSK